MQHRIDDAGGSYWFASFALAMAVSTLRPLPAAIRGAITATTRVSRDGLYLRPPN
jgi:hypothetical protein